MINLSKFIEMIKGGSKILSLECDYINDLNVFPVPDGDTGSNMDATVKGAITFNIDNKNIESFEDLAKSFSKGLLMNARGNSGVIFSQIMRGFFSNFTNEFVELTPKLLQESFILAKEKAYSSVINPIEGTILTVIRVIAEQVNKKLYSSVNELFTDVIKYGEIALADTPNLLSELKEVGVVDSGGYGLLSFLKGMDATLNNNIDSLVQKINQDLVVKKGTTAYIDESNFEFFNQSKNEEGFGYCSEIILNLSLSIDPNLKEQKEPFNLEKFKEELLRIGNSLVCVQMDNLVKVHIHTMKPNRLLQIGQKFGEFEKVKIENMTLQYEQKVHDSSISNDNSNVIKINDVNPKPGLGIVATAPSNEIATFYKEDFNVDEVIVTENASAPSTQDFLNAIFKIGKKNCLIITDDTNLVLAANQAKEIASKKFECEVIPGKNAFEAIVAASNVNPDTNIKNNSREITKIVKKTLSAVLSTSIKNVSYSHINVDKGSNIGIINKKIVVSVKDEFAALKLTLDKLIGNKKGLDICFLIYGANANVNVIKQFEKYASEQYGLYCEIRKGNQKTYNYYIGLQ